MKILNIILKVLLVLLLVMPILGTLGVFPAPTAEMYTTPEGWALIEILMSTGYIMYLIASVFAVSIVLILLNRMALAAILIAPISVNILAFHLFLEGGIFNGASVMADVLFLLNAYFLWQNRDKYQQLW